MVQDQLRARDIHDQRVLDVMARLSRRRFIPDPWKDQAYLDQPTPIGAGQTISQPYIVAVMSQLLAVDAGARVLELGTGSGYQAAVLAAMGIEVYSIEIIPELAEGAAATLAALGYDQVRVRTGDAWQGWPEAAPFDGIIVTAAAPRIPEPLVEQLRVGGRLVIPLGAPHQVQQLATYLKQPDGSLTGHAVLPVAFVPVTGLLGRRTDPAPATPATPS
jgi:protein-L-isoaspartate(D-aspartate) O-methyltransferase